MMVEAKKHIFSKCLLFPRDYEIYLRRFHSLLVLITPAQCQQTAPYWYNKGVDFFIQNKYDEAIRLDPQNSTPWVGKGLALDRQGKYEEAIKADDEAIRLDPNDTYVWNNKGLALYGQSKYSESIKAYERAIELDPNYVTAWSNKGIDLGVQGRYNEAVQAFDKAIEIDPQDAKDWYNKGAALESLGLTMEAEAAFAKAKELGYDGSTPETTTASPNAMLSTYILDNSMASNVDESTNSVITRTHKFFSTDSKAHSWLKLGNIGAGTVSWYWYSPDGNLYKADSVDISPSPSGGNWPFYYIWYYIDIAGDMPADLPGDWHVDIYLDGQKLLTEHFTLDSNAIQPNTDDADAWNERGIALADQGRYDEAILAFNESIRLDPNRADSWYFKGVALYDMGKYDDALKAYEEAIRLKSKPCRCLVQ
jgi:tetratricopeptide (TPR) repeat protein